MDIDTEILEAALRNALRHDGEAQTEAVMSKVLGNNPELRDDVPTVKKEVEETVKQVNRLDEPAQMEEAVKLGIQLERDSEPEEEGLPELEGVQEGDFITRFAPNPNAPLHLGNARALVLSGIYANRYDGKLILRFDDTDPRTKAAKAEAYEWIEQDVEWLGFEPDVVLHASSRIDVYQNYMMEVIQKGDAYVCTCDADEWSRMAKKSEKCPCRELQVDENEQRWADMLADQYSAGEAVVRVKTDMEHPNPAIRDWPAFRIIDDPDHPRVGDEYNVWPLYNFASAVDDHDFNVTHILRGQEHTTNTEKQEWLYDHMNWEMPEVIHHGRLSIEGFVLSKSQMSKKIDEGEYKGWDDPRLGTLRALKRRGFQPEAVRHIMEHFGIKSSDATMSLDKLEAENKNHIDFPSNRYYFIPEPVKFTLEGGDKEKARLPLHPDDDARGHRELQISREIYINKKDAVHNDGETMRLKGLFNVEVDRDDKVLTYAGDEIVQEMDKVQWLPPAHTEGCRIVMPDSTEKEGLVEDNFLQETISTVVQFERFGFVRMDKKDPLICYFTHE